MVHDTGMTTDDLHSEEIAFTPVARVGDIPVGEGRTFEVSGRLVAIFFDGTTYSAIDDLCPHMGASLGSGPLSDGVVTYPWHAWRFRLCDGAWCDNPKLSIDVFPVRIIDSVIAVAVLPSKPASLPPDDSSQHGLRQDL